MKRFYMAICLTGVFLLGGCGLSSEENITAPSAESTAAVPQTASPEVDAQPSTPAQSASPQETVYHKEEVAEVAGISVKLLSVEEQTPAADDTLAMGKKYVICKFHLENHTEQEVLVNSQRSFEAFGDGMAVLPEDGKKFLDVDLLDGAVKPGDTLEGSVIFKLPADWKEIELAYIPGIPGQRLTFRYQKQM